MSAKINRKAEVLVAIALVLLSALVAAGTTHALEPQKGTIDFVLLYQDKENPSDVNYLSGVSAYLYDMNGSLKSVSVSGNNGIVDFGNIVYGNYIIKVNAIRKGGYVYTSGYAVINFNKDGVKSAMTGATFTSMRLDRYPLTHKLNITVEKKGLLSNVQISILKQDYMFINKTIELSYNATNDTSTGATIFNVTEGAITVKAVYTDGGVNKTYYQELNIAKSSSMTNIVINIDNYTRVLGTLRVKNTGEIVSTPTHVIIINNTNNRVWKSLTFNGGAFSFYLPSRDYTLMITADGYGVAKKNLQTSGESFISAEVSSVTNHVNVNAILSSNLQWINVTYTEEISNKSVIMSLPYSDTGMLSYQMELLGWNNNDLLNYLKNKYAHYTTNFVTIDGNIYELQGIPQFTHGTINLNGGFTITLKATYYNGEIKKSELLKDGTIQLTLYGQKDGIFGGANIAHTYTINITSLNLERSNDVANAKVAGYTGTITITNLTSNKVNIVLKERKSPEIRLDNEHFIVGWANMSNVNHVVNQSADNYTIVVPANKEVWFNASQMVYDVVRGKVDTEHTNYTWYIDNKPVNAPNPPYNLTSLFKAGKHILTLKATDVGGNVNETNVTLLADGYWPTANITLKDPSGKILATFKANETNLKVIEYNITGKIGRAAMGSNYTVRITTPLIINESEEVMYNAKASYDTFNGVNKTGLPIIVEWNFNGNKSTGLNRSYAFDRPSRNGTYYVNVTLRDSVNNTIIISIPVKVKDITPPVVILNFTANGKNVDEVKEGENVTLDATGSYDPDNGTIVNYNWTIKDSNYKEIYVTSGIYELVSGSFTSNNVTLIFHKYGKYYIILNATDAAGNYKVVNKTLNVAPVRPDLAINNVNIKGDRIEGNTLSVEVNVSNNGNAIAKTYWVAIYINGKVVVNKTYRDLKNGTYAIRTLKWTPSSPGNYTLTVKTGCSDEPSSYLSDNEKQETVKIAQAPWKMPAIIGGSIAIIIIAGYVAWRYMQKKGEKKKFKKGGKKSKQDKGKKEKSKKEEKKEKKD